MPDTFMLFSLLLSIILILMLIMVLLCGVFIRPYIKKNGRSTVKGTYRGSTVMADASVADEICKKKGEYPWFLRLFWIIVFLEFALVTGSVVTVIIMTK